MEQDFSFETVTVDRAGQIVARRMGRARQVLVRLSEGVDLEMVVVPGGSFRMGSPPGQGYLDERPQRPVTVAPFLLGKYPVTQAQWAAVMGELPPCRGKGPRRPVENVAWGPADEFCRRLSALTGGVFTLPWEEQWEYACRASTTTPFAYGETITTDLANYVGEHTYAAEAPGAYRHGTTDVGSFPPNNFGLYDMHGNVWEWCADLWRADHTVGGTTHDAEDADEQGRAGGRAAAGPYRVARGGSWHDGPDLLRSATRLRFRADEGDDFLGLRVMARA
jgi:formylglycine-generating enzyme required for sulfatase activity